MVRFRSKEGRPIADVLDALKDHIAHKEMAKGSGTGPLSRALTYFAGVPSGVAALTAMVCDGQWFVAAAVVIAAFTHVSVFALPAAAAYLGWRGSWLAAGCVLVYVIAGFVAAFVGKQHARRLIDRGAPLLHEFTGAPDMVFWAFLMCGGIVAMIAAEGTLRTVGVVVCAIGILGAIGRFLLRCTPPWVRVHYPLTFMFIRPAAQEWVHSQREGREVDRTAATRGMLEQFWSAARAMEVVERADARRRSLVDVEGVTAALLREHPGADPEKVKALALEAAQFAAANETPGAAKAGAIAEVVEVSFGPEERHRYLAALLEGKPK